MPTSQADPQNAIIPPGAAPLKGVKVLELARILAGPWCGQMLADLGADVIKVERPGEGDDTRHWGPPFVETSAGENLSAGYYHSCNRGKRSVTIDFTTPEGQAEVLALAAEADIVLENYKLGGLKKYGLDAETLREKFPKLIYCSVTGFGQTGPYAPRPGYDFIIQGMGGMMSITGEPDGPPQKGGVAYADIFTGVYATIGILAALNQRHVTGEGAYVDMALLDCQVAVLGNQALNWMVSGNVPHRMGNGHMNLAPYQSFPTSDGDVIIAVGNDRQFKMLCDLLGTEALAADPRFATNPGRVENRAALIPLLVAKTVTFTKAEMLTALKEKGISAGPINRIDEVFADPQVVARGLQLSMTDDFGATLPGLASPVVIDGKRAVSGRPAPRLGEHQGARFRDTDEA